MVTNRQFKTRMSTDGRIVIPAECRHALGLRPGDELTVRIVGQEHQASSAQDSLRRAQALLRRYVSPERDLVAELIAERRAASARE